MQETAFRITAVALMAGFMASGCFFSRSVDPAYEALVEGSQEAPETGELGADDRIKLRIFNEEELSGEFTVSEEGTINYPHLGRLKVAGLTCGELEERIETGLRDGYLKEPSASCSIVEYNSKRIYVLGEVKEPGSYPYKANLTIVEAFALAGGATNRAAKNKTKLTREVEGEDVQVRVPMQDIVEGRRKNLRLLPGDVVYVPESAY